MYTVVRPYYDTCTVSCSGSLPIQIDCRGRCLRMRLLEWFQKWQYCKGSWLVFSFENFISGAGRWLARWNPGLRNLKNIVKTPRGCYLASARRVPWMMCVCLYCTAVHSHDFNNTTDIPINGFSRYDGCKRSFHDCQWWLWESQQLNVTFWSQPCTRTNDYFLCIAWSELLRTKQS